MILLVVQLSIMIGPTEHLPLTTGLQQVIDIFH